MTDKLWTVYIDDNFHFMDESERLTHGTFDGYDEAVSACRKIVDEFLQDNPAQTAEDLYESYVRFGEDPWIWGAPPPPGSQRFSARDYARQRCNELRPKVETNGAVKVPFDERNLDQDHNKQIESFPLPSRANPQTKPFDEPGIGERSIGWAKGEINDGRPYWAECWTQDGITMVTINFSSEGLNFGEDRSLGGGLQVKGASPETIIVGDAKAAQDFLEKEGLFEFRDRCFVTPCRYLDDNGKFWSINVVVGDQDSVYCDGKIMFHRYGMSDPSTTTEPEPSTSENAPPIKSPTEITHEERPSTTPSSDFDTLVTTLALSMLAKDLGASNDALEDANHLMETMDKSSIDEAKAKAYVLYGLLKVTEESPKEPVAGMQRSFTFTDSNHDGLTTDKLKPPLPGTSEPTRTKDHENSNVEVAIQSSDDDDDLVPTFENLKAAIGEFARAKFDALARRVIVRLQRHPAVGLNGGDPAYKTLWDEFCHEVQFGPSDDELEDAWDFELRRYMDAVIDDLPDHVPPLLSIYAGPLHEDRWGSESIGGVSRDALREELRDRLGRVAGERSFNRFWE